MEKFNPFKVRLSGLKLGKHSFEFEVDDSFFEKLDYSPIRSGDVKVNVQLEKKPSLLNLDFKLNGWVMAECDRCTAGFKQPITGEFRIFVKYGDSYDEPSEDLIVIPQDAHELDVSQMIYEFIGLSVPLRKIPCEDSGDTSICDKDVLKVLEDSATEGENRNPMWAALNGFKDQLNKN